jgi:hypothetical protein
MAPGGRRSSRFVPRSSLEGDSTTGPRVCNAATSAVEVTSGVSAGRIASASAALAVASSSTCWIAAPSDGRSSTIAWARRAIAISNTCSSGDTTHVSHPSSAPTASSTSSNIASVRAARSRGVSRGESLDFP